MPRGHRGQPISRSMGVEPMKPEEVNGPPALFQLVERMMSLDPRIRYQTPAQLLEAVKEVRQEMADPGSVKARPAASSVTVFVVVGAGPAALQNALRGKLQGARPSRSDLRETRLRAAHLPFGEKPYDAVIMDAGATGEEGKFAFDQILIEARRISLPCGGVLILNQEQAEWAKQTEVSATRKVLVRPVSLKNVMDALARVLAPQPSQDETETLTDDVDRRPSPRAERGKGK